MAFLFLVLRTNNESVLELGIVNLASALVARVSRPPEFRGTDTNCPGLECCLTIVSEERETWAADSLRGLVVGLGFGAS